MVLSSSAAGFQVCLCHSTSFMNSLVLLSSHSSSIAITCSLKFGHLFLVLSVSDVMEDLFSGFLKAKSVWCKCTKKYNFGKYMISLYNKKMGSMTNKI